MHELGLVRGVVETALAEFQRAGAARLIALNVILQDDGHTDAESLALHFETLARGTAAESARLNLTRRPIESRCWSCGNVFAGDPLETVCPKCGSPGLRVSPAHELILDSIEVE